MAEGQGQAAENFREIQRGKFVDQVCFLLRVAGTARFKEALTNFMDGHSTTCFMGGEKRSGNGG